MGLWRIMLALLAAAGATAAEQHLILGPETTAIRFRLGATEIRLHGRLRIHGTTQPTEIVADVRIDEEEIEATGRFSVPYVALGMRDPSKLVLRVAKEVEVEMRFSGRLEEAASSG